MKYNFILHCKISLLFFYGVIVLSFHMVWSTCGSRFTIPLHFFDLLQKSPSILLFLIDLHSIFSSSTMSIASSSSVNNGNTPLNHNNGASSNPNKGYQNDTLNPYFMHPNENPTLVLVTPLLNVGNYHSWSCSMTMTLR